MERKAISIGGSDFETIIRNDYLYVDKTMMIKDLIDSASTAILFTRPRRFGKSLNMSMLKYFFEINAETADLFENLDIWTCGDKYRVCQGKYPVISLTFFDFSEPDWTQAFNYFKKNIADEFIRHNCIFKSDILIQEEKEQFLRIKQRTADIVDYKSSLKDLTRWLYQYYGVKPILLIDEYDKPIQKAYTSGYYKEMMDFLKGFYTGGVKDNPYLTKGIMTGVLRIAKESIFTGMNNFDVYSIFSDPYAQYFGFTETEVHALSEVYGAAEKVEQVKYWYDGYCFGSTEIYNPWSVLQYYSRGCIPEAYWLSTSGNDIIHAMFKNISVKTLTDLTALMQGKSITATIPVELVYPDVGADKTGVALYALLLMTGYLKKMEDKRISGNIRSGQNLRYRCVLKIPNREIMEVYQAEILEYVERYCVPEVTDAIQMAISENDTETLQKELSRFLMESTSHFDGAYEVFYQGLMLGQVSMMRDGYYVYSNLESGEGRFDILLKPKRKTLPGIIIELKSIQKSFSSDTERDTKLEVEAAHALWQIEHNDYAVQLTSHGIDRRILYGMAFCGKHVRVVSKFI